MNGIYQNDCAEHRRSAVATTVSRMLRANTIKGADGTTITSTQADPRRAWLVAKYSLSTDPKWHSIDLFMAPSHHGTATRTGPHSLDWLGRRDGWKVQDAAAAAAVATAVFVNRRGAWGWRVVRWRQAAAIHDLSHRVISHGNRQWHGVTHPGAPVN